MFVGLDISEKRRECELENRETRGKQRWPQVSSGNGKGKEEIDELMLLLNLWLLTWCWIASLVIHSWRRGALKLWIRISREFESHPQSGVFKVVMNKNIVKLHMTWLAQMWQVWNVSAPLHHLYLTRKLFSRTRPQPCDRKVDLYILEPKALVLKDSTRSARVLANKNCSRYVHLMFRLV